MKTIKFLILVSILTSLICACNQTPEIERAGNKEEGTTLIDKNTPTNARDTISKDTFVVWKKRWDNNFRKYMATDSLHYADIPLVDFRDILNESPVDSARIYLGMDAKKLPHFMMVGLYKGKPNFKVIADYSKVCPPYCTE